MEGLLRHLPLVHCIGHRLWFCFVFNVWKMIILFPSSWDISGLFWRLVFESEIFPNARPFGGVRGVTSGVFMFFLKADLDIFAEA
jgi:hypothetical protein